MAVRHRLFSSLFLKGDGFCFLDRRVVEWFENENGKEDINYVMIISYTGYFVLKNV